jgi:hypothetical protein
MTDAEDLTFDEEAAMEAVRERSVPHPRDILKREHDRILRSSEVIGATWRWRSGARNSTR